MNEVLIVAGLLLGGLIASEIGFRVGATFKRDDDALGKQLDVIRSATLALVAFLVAFAFSGAGGRFVERLDIIVQEANALGTAWLRADVLPEPHRGELRAALKEYTADRVTLLRSRDWDEIHRLLDKVGAQQAGMWNIAVTGAHGDAPLMNLVLPPLNDVFDLHTSHLALANRSLPRPILIVLLATAALSLVLVGVGNGRSGRRFPVLDAIYAAVLAVALWMTIDLDRPRQGLIQVNSQPLVDTLASMK
ncbi:MAG TPA: hypothetical protein VJV39_04255 [Dongiaceae bacterium]|nr:hypothetical protein [Dongiaceae bacterium]